MKKFINLFMLLGLCAGFGSCSSDDNVEPVDENGINVAQKEILANYINQVVVPTYKSLADAAILLAKDCEDLSTQAAVDKACNDWVEARKYWELSEAFLFGAAADYNIDPHIDSWPLDLTQLDEVLKAGNIEERIDAGTAGYGLLGFHAVEYVIFKEGSTGDASNRHRDFSTISEAEATFAAAVAADMRDQCVRLEAAWAGIDNVSAAKKAILEEAELEPTLNYGEMIIGAGMAGNAKYKTQAAAFEEILVGASDIANEVGNTKMADPMASHQWSDVESPHSWNSVADFIDNIRSVRNAYYGSLDGTVASKSVSVHIASCNSSADQNIKAALTDCLKKMEALPRPFRNYINVTSGAEYQTIQAAIDACNTLVDALDAAQEALN